MWKKLLLILWLFFPVPIQAQGTTFYLPLILKTGCDIPMSNFKIVIPSDITNKVLNPSAETTGNFAAEAGTTVTRSTTYQHYGLYSYRVETNANNEGIEITLSALTNAIHYVTVRVRGTLPAAWDWSLDDSTFTAPTLLEQIDANWALYGLQFPAAQANGSTKLSIHQNGAGTGDFYLDGIQVEEAEIWSTYCDGTQDGCAWLGSPNASASQRSAASRAGGVLYDLVDDYAFNVESVIGGNAPPQILGIDSYAILPGGELNSKKIQSRVFTLTGEFIGATSQADLHAKQAALLEALQGDAYPGNQALRLRYEGSTVHKEIALHYENGLGGELQATHPCYEKAAIRFIAPYPYWQEIGESAVALDTEDSGTFRLVAGRLKSTGQWSVLGPPNASGTYTDIQAIAEDDTYIYLGGNFQNFDNIANADYIVRWHKQNQVFSALGSGLSSDVSALAVSPSGVLYIGGAFLNAGGVANADYICTWDGSAFAAVGNPNSGGAAITQIYALEFSKTGLLYIGGIFTNLAGNANADRIASWDGSSYSALSTGADSSVFALAVGPDDTLYVAGAFGTIGGVSATRIASWNGTAFSALSSGLNGNGLALTVNQRTGLMYAGGGFTTAGGVSANRIASWNGSAFGTLGDGLANNSVEGLAVGNDDILYVVGDFTQAGSITLADRMARWNGYTWSHLDVDLPGSGIIYAVLASKFADPVIDQKYDLFVGFLGTGTGTFAGKVSPDNDSTVQAFPKIVYERSGGTSATIATLRNETTGKELLFSYALLNGEKLTIDLNPTNRTIISSFFGSRPDAVLANSDFGTWSLLAGDNDITSFVINSGATVTAYMLWKDTYTSY